jgi:hypothetical protein
MLEILIAIIIIAVLGLLICTFLFAVGGLSFGLGSTLLERAKGVTAKDHLRRMYGESAEELAERKKVEARRRALVDAPNETPEERQQKQQQRFETEERRRYLDSLVDK